jgi:hypothetical protein
MFAYFTFELLIKCDILPKTVDIFNVESFVMQFNQIKTFITFDWMPSIYKILQQHRFSRSQNKKKRGIPLGLIFTNRKYRYKKITLAKCLQNSGVYLMVKSSPYISVNSLCLFLIFSFSNVTTSRVLLAIKIHQKYARIILNVHTTNYS